MNRFKATREFLEIVMSLFMAAYLGSIGYNLFLAVGLGVLSSFAITLPVALWAGIKAGVKAWRETK